MSKHTPGPWHYKVKRFKNYPRDYEHGWYARIRAAGSTCLFGVADVEGPSNRDKFTEWEANVHLIAAAPDLMAACEMLLAAAIDGDYSYDSQGQEWPEIKQAKTAIAKAKGEVVDD